jgi:uncharacterized protein YutE (UPF0331/DUF86 family)
MNTQFQELMYQAGLTAQGCWDEMDGYDHTAIEKFAELIVQECIDIIAPYTVRMSRPGEEYLHPIQEIKDHFGVGE